MGLLEQFRLYVYKSYETRFRPVREFKDREGMGREEVEDVDREGEEEGGF
jgi:hypothetical protein